MARPFRPGAVTTHGQSKASYPDKPIGTWFADSIRASSPYRLHQQAGQTTATDQNAERQFMLATREPSTDDCINRPDRRLQPTKTPNVNLCLQRGSHPQKTVSNRPDFRICCRPSDPKHYARSWQIAVSPRSEEPRLNYSNKCESRNTSSA